MQIISLDDVATDENRIVLVTNPPCTEQFATVFLRRNGVDPLVVAGKIAMPRAKMQEWANTCTRNSLDLRTKVEELLGAAQDEVDRDNQEAADARQKLINSWAQALNVPLQSTLNQ